MIPWYFLIPAILISFFMGILLGIKILDMGIRVMAKEHPDAAEALSLLQKAANEAEH